MDSRNTCHIERHGQECVLEFVAFRWPPAGFDSAAWPSAPGGAVRAASGRTTMLHFAPGRWLVPAPTNELLQQLDDAALTGAGVKLDVTGKWERISITGPGSTRLLASAIGIDSLLADRDCAAATLFDCPAIIARGNGGFESWVQSSYAVDFLATTGRFRALLQSTLG
jgi:heterotetrameric sarcosine oxidase gamma subunit